MMTQMNCVCFKWLIEVYWQPVFQLGFRAVYLYMSGCVCCITLSSNSSISCSVNAGGFNREYFNCKRSPTSSMMPIACNRSILVLQTTSLQLKILTEFGKVVGWLCWGLTSQSTIFQSCRDGAIASWVINQYFRGVKCLAQGHNTAAVGLEPRTSRSGVRHSTTEPPRSPWERLYI